MEVIPHATLTHRLTFLLGRPDARVLAEPLFLEGEVVKGFGRGSKLLGIPTANLDEEALAQLPESFPNGIYFGFATVDGVGPFEMVSSVGHNPYFANECPASPPRTLRACRDIDGATLNVDGRSRTVEPHLLHEFKDDFYGATIRVLITGYLRAEAKFSSLDSLIEAIKEDIRVAQAFLARHDQRAHRAHKALRAPPRVPTGLVVAGALAAGAGAVWLFSKRKE